MADNIVYINTEEGVKRVMNNVKLYAKLLTKFKDDPSFNDLEAAMAEGDMEKVKVSSHTLKGLAANLALTELSKQSLELESQIKNGKLNPKQITFVKNVYHQTIAEIEKVIAQYA
ncbi:MAG: Hpt domain-containing protein [Treponema sp.]|nr:Hpt domain-containing protein [Treponema sp.]